MVVITTKSMPETSRVVAHTSHTSHDCVPPLHLQTPLATGPWLIPQTTPLRAETSQSSDYAYRERVCSLWHHMHGVGHMCTYSCLHASKVTL